MHRLLADRFVALGTGWIDLASGTSVRIRFAPAGEMSAQRVWSDQCAEFARLRHPLINTLLDYGCAESGKTFEAYSIRGPIQTSGATGSLVLTHGVRFIESNGLLLTPELAHACLRDVSIGNSPSRGRPLGIIVQPRKVLAGLTDALEEASPGGTATIDIAGPRGSGLRTVRTLAARAARLGGYVPISSAVLLRLPRMHERLWERHVCVLLDHRHSTTELGAVATLLAQLGTVSARRHVLVRFTRSSERFHRALQIDPMGVTAMTAMVFVDPDCGPSHDELFNAARDAAGRPGAFLESLRASNFGDRVARVAVVHESSPDYVFQPTAPVSASRIRGVGRALLDAPGRAARLAERGRHASAVRLLTRASRVLEARGDSALAAACVEQLAWIDRDRGRTDGALEHFERARSLVGNGLPSVRAAIGIGVIWTDQQRFIEAEAALRGACAAADLLNDSAVRSGARRALARCLYWQSRHDEVAVTLAPLVDSEPHDEGGIEAWALLARARAATGDLRGAVAAAREALRGAERVADCRALATAARSMAIAQMALGDHDQVRRWVERGLGAAASAHVPLLGLRLRGLLVCSMSGTGRVSASSDLIRLTGHLRTALKHRPLPTLLRAELEAAVAGSRTAVGASSGAAAQDSGLVDLQQLLELAQAAPDDHSAVESVCRVLCERLRAASVQIVSGPREPRTLARAGRPWHGDGRVIDRAFAGGGGTPAGFSCEPRQAAEPIRYGQEPIAVLCCRWTIGIDVDAERAFALLRAGALAAAASVRGLLDRSQPAPAETVCGELIGACAAAVALRSAIVRAARAPFPVLVEGESGSGKELVARAIHRLSPRRDRRLCTVNCAALSDDLLEAELFGHSRGAFTGAVGERAGLFEEADGGTLFLDEVGELSPRAQAKLLRVLQDGEVRRVGENMPRRVDARIVAATNRQLDEEVGASRFRADLRFRLDVVRIAVPPLRERAPDIPALAALFWAESAARVGSSATLTSETIAALARYDWPGNVRELQNVVASLAVHAPRRGRIVPAMLPEHIARSSSTAATFEAARQEFERRFVRAALAQAGGQRARAARSLGVSRQGLAKMMRRLHIDG